MNVFAYINHGRIVADCPRCNSAELVMPGQPIFKCGRITERGEVGCLFEAPLEFPSNLMQIQTILAKRPVIENRNWIPGETIDMLTAENIEHGIGAAI